MPEINIGVSDIARAALDGLKWFVSLPEGGYPSEYPKHPERGAAAMLDAALDTQPELPFEPQYPQADFYPPFIDRSRS
jgi:hypothetical protein